MNTPAPALPTPDDVLRYWLGDDWRGGWPADDRHALWFGGGPERDAEIRERFGPLLEAALARQLDEWAAPLDHRLALVIVLDQFSRNVHRGQARAFAGDGLAQRLVLQTLDRAQDTELPVVGRVFLYMPLMHAEDLTLQQACVAQFTRLAGHAPPELAPRLQGHLRAAQQHRDIVARFGRFPHRNAALGRPSTPDETAFLIDGPRFGQ